MGKLKSFCKLSKFLWDNSEQVFNLLSKLQGNIPLLVNALNQSADALVIAAGIIGSVEGEVGDTLIKTGATLNAIEIPKLEISTSGFMDVLMDALKKVLVVDPIEPAQEIKDCFNKIRVLNKAKIDGQYLPFGALATIFDLEGQIILVKSESTKQAISNTSNGLREFALVLEEMEQA